MWLGDALIFTIREMGYRSLAVPCALLAVAWGLWFGGLRPLSALRRGAFVSALVVGTIAVGVQVALAAWWYLLHPWLYHAPATCAVIPYVGDVSVVAAAVSILLSTAGHGPGRLLVFLAGACLLPLVLWGAW